MTSTGGNGPVSRGIPSRDGATGEGPEDDDAETPLVDVHCHLVPGVDDGARTLEEALDWLIRYREEGIHEVVTTPHLPAEYARSSYRRRTEERFRELERAAGERLPDLRLSLAYEIRLDGTPVDPGDEGLWMGPAGHVLVEYEWLRMPDDPLSLLEPLLEAGRIPVLAHPERYFEASRRYGELRALRDRGALFCLNAGSLWGGYGPEIRSLAWRMVEEGDADLVGSDHHGRPERSDSLRRAWRLLARKAGRRQADRLAAEAPAAVARGGEVPAPATGSAVGGREEEPEEEPTRTAGGAGER